MRSLLALPLLLVTTSCTTLENRRDLYRSPGEGYEEFYPEPPPTRKPAGPPTAPNNTTEGSGAIIYPEESLPGNGH